MGKLINKKMVTDDSSIYRCAECGSSHLHSYYIKNTIIYECDNNHVVDIKHVKHPHSIEKLHKIEKELEDRVWYDREMLCINMGHVNPNDEDVKKHVGEIEEKYGKENLGPYTDFEWGMLNGKLSAIRWVLGARWDDLDT